MFGIAIAVISVIVITGVRIRVSARLLFRWNNILAVPHQDCRYLRAGSVALGRQCIAANARDQAVAHSPFHCACRVRADLSGV